MTQCMTQCMTQPDPRTARLGALLLCASALLFATPGCNVIDVLLGRDVTITEMVPGMSIAGGSVECWLTLDFKNVPEDARPTDVYVRFESVALTSPADFDWSYIATHDVVRAGSKLGSGYRDLSASTPGAPPPLGTPIKVKFPLRLKRELDDAPRRVWLKATVYWGGVEQDSEKRRLEHVYSTTRNGVF